VVDWRNRPKRAYGALQSAYRPVFASMRYDKLVWKPGECFDGQVWLHNEREDFVGSLRVVVRNADGADLFREFCSVKMEPDSCLPVLQVRLEVPAAAGWLDIEMDLEKGETHIGSRYLLPVSGEDGFCRQDVAMAARSYAPEM
jgi:beta-mannosidase